MIVSMLTTVDNPHSPFDEWDAWLAWDMRAGYNTSGMLARIAVVSDEISDYDYNLAMNQAIDEIVKMNVLGVFRKVTKEFPDPE
jgi:hypothetical protein